MPADQLPPLIRALLRPAAYPHPVDRVQLVQTHISYVLLAGEHVYKIKKPVNFGFLDYSTLGKRRYYCHREVALNSRLCSDTYLGVVQVREDDRGRYAIGGAGRLAEYAVHMRRLPEDRMMHRLLERGEVTAEMVERVAERLVPYHASSDAGPGLARYGDWAIRYNWRENVHQWRPYIGRALTPEQDRALRAYGEAFFARKAGVMQRRVDELRIRRVHADLRSDAVCFLDGVCIFDCVEFSRRLSLLDVARDVGFLDMDLRYRGRPDLAQAFVRRYIELSGDKDMPEVIGFYAAYSACVRGKVEAFLLDQPEVPAAEKRRAQKAARRYFELACEYAASLPPALLLITCGLTATGKSTLARRLAGSAGFEVISSDVARKQLAGIEPSEHRFETFRAGIYSPDFTDRTYRALFEAARPALIAGRSVIIDASFVRRQHRRWAARLARETGAQFACVEMTAGDAAVRRRLARRLREGGDPSDARWEIYVAQKRTFQPPTEIAPERLVRVDTAKPVAAETRAVIAALRRLSPLSLPPPDSPGRKG